MEISFSPYQTLSDLCEPETIRNHFRLLNIHEKIAFLTEKCFCCGKIPPPTLAQPRKKRKSMLSENNVPKRGRMNGRMADGSFKIWITEFKVAVVYVLNYKHQQECSKARVDFSAFESRGRLQTNLKSSKGSRSNLLRGEKGERTKIDELYHQLEAPRFNCVEGLILSNITFNFSRKFLPP